MIDDKIDWDLPRERDERDDRIYELESRVSNLERGAQSAGIGAYGFGMMIAIVLSWSKNASILWCIFHGILSWIYVVYFAFAR